MAPSRRTSSGSEGKPVHINDSKSYLQNGVCEAENYVRRSTPTATIASGGTDLLRRLFTKEYVTVEAMPEQYREKFLVRGYRQPYSSVLDCVVSTVRPNNETLNIWTHFIPFLVLLAYFWWSFPGRLWPPAALESRFYPLLSLEMSVCAYLLCSSLAHLFNCMTPRIRHVCFYFDYTAISIYSIGGGCATFYYLRPLHSGLTLFESPNLFLFHQFLWSLLACYINCASRHRWDGMKYVVRTLALTLPFLYGNLPLFYRFLECGWTGQECSFALPYFFMGWTCYLISALLNASRIPERFYPSTFDIVGHNHQWVHVITTFGTMAHIFAVFNDLDEKGAELEEKSFPQVTFMGTLGWTVITFILTVTLSLWFGSHLTSSGHLCGKEKNS